MRQISSTDMREIQGYLEQNKQSGRFLICGSSEDIDPYVQQLLNNGTERENTLQYFLCSGSKAFHVPCYLAGRTNSQNEELPSVETILNGVRTKQSSPQNVAKSFERRITGLHANSSPMIVVECLTPPQPDEHIFIERLLAFAATRHALSMIIVLHQDAKDQSPEQDPQDALIQEHLLLLYLCGGRVRTSDWQQLGGSQYASHPWITARRVGTETWLCYARGQDAEWAARTFEGLAPEIRERLLRKVLHNLQRPADYPTLALVAKTKNLELSLARSVFPPLECALTEPRAMSKYFYHLRRAAKRTGDPDLISTATLNYVASLLCLPAIQTIRLYRVLDNDRQSHAKNSLARLYGELGQRLMKARDPLILEAAAECFRRSRRYVDEGEHLTNEERQSAIAAIANGEALLAFKQGQPELACQIEKAGLARLQQIAPSAWLASQEMLLRTNLGDVYLRLLNNSGAAIEQYQAAYGLAIKWSSVAMECYVAPKLAEVLIRVGQREQAIEILEKFLARPDSYLTIEEKIALKARLTLAQAYWQSGSHRRAALWYWRLLQRPHYLAPATLRGISSNLRHCRPGMSPQLQAHIDSIVVTQEDTLNSIKQIRDYLIAL